MYTKIKGGLTEQDVVDYSSVIKTYPWLIERDQNCILSPDADGILCGLFMSRYLGWRIRGFYDGKVLLVQRELKPKDCIFLDMEIYRKGVRSVGQHMVMYNRDRPPKYWDNFENSLSANNMREYDAKHYFSQKYPLASVHLLLGVLGSLKKIEIPTTAICLLLYTDGTFKNLFNYPDNCMSWLRFLKADQRESPLYKIFFNDHYSITTLMLALKELFDELRLVGDGKRGGDKIKFSNTKGELINFDREKETFEEYTLNRAERALRLLAEKTQWEYKASDWAWNNLSSFILKKGNIKPSQGRFDDLMSQNPVSFAMTSGLSIEFTLDPKGIFGG